MPMPEGWKPQSSGRQDGERKIYDILPEDAFTFEILDLEPCTIEDYNTKQEKPGVKVTLLALDQDYEFEGEHCGKQQVRGRRVWLDVTPKLVPPGDYPASKLYQIASAAFGGRDFTKAECDSFDLNTLIGRQIKAGIKVKTSQRTKRPYNKVVGFFQNRRPLPRYDGENEPAPPHKVIRADGTEATDLPF